MHRGLHLRQPEYSHTRTCTTTELDNSGTVLTSFQGRTLHHRRPAQLVDMVAPDFMAALDRVDLADLQDHMDRSDLQDLMDRLADLQDLQDLQARLDHHHQDLLVGRLVAVEVEVEEDLFRVAEGGFLHHRGLQAAQSR